jgi:hypothetical protein
MALVSLGALDAYWGDARLGNRFRYFRPDRWGRWTRWTQPRWAFLTVIADRIGVRMPELQSPFDCSKVSP